MQFPWRIIGHQKVLERLEEEFAKDRLAQSYLFYGPREIGKFRLVKTLATLLQCDHKNLCRDCDSCERVEKNTHSTTIVVDRLWTKDKAENLEELAKYTNFDQIHRKKSGKKTDQIGVDDVLEFIRPLWNKTDTNFKICVIRDLERMTTEAMNTFLKILEEPPQKTLFLLTATHRDSLLPTIVSRTRVIEMGLVQNSVLKKHLESQNPQVSGKMCEKMLTLSQGRPSRLLRFLSDTQFLKSQDDLFQKISFLLKTKNVPQFFSLAEQLSKPENETDLFEFLDSLSHFLRTLLREKILGKSLSLGNQFDFFDVILLLEKIETLEQQLKQNVNKRLALESLLLKM